VHIFFPGDCYRSTRLEVDGTVRRGGTVRVATDLGATGAGGTGACWGAEASGGAMKASKGVGGRGDIMNL
jgi:hypothetical protein